MAKLIEALKDRSIFNGARLAIFRDADGKIDVSAVQRTSFTSVDDNGDLDEYLKVPLVKPMFVGMSVHPDEVGFEIDHVYIRESLFAILDDVENFREDKDGGYFVRKKKIGDVEVEKEFETDISATHSADAGFAFAIYQEEKIAAWIRGRRSQLSDERKTKRQSLLEAIRAKKKGQ